MFFMHHLWDLILFLVILLGPLPLCWSLVMLMESGKERPGAAQRWLALLTGWCIIETCIGLLLGILRHLTLNAVLMSELTLFGAGIILCILLRPTVIARRPQGAELPSLRLRYAQGDRWTHPPDILERLILGAISLVGVALLWNLATRLIINYDSLMYHLPAMAKWYQTASLTMLEQFHDLQSTYPYNWEVLCTLFLMPFREDSLVAFPNLIAWMLLGLSVYLLGIHIGATRIYSLAAASLVLTMPHVIQNVNTMHIDLPFAAFFMAGLYFAVAYHQTRSTPYFALFLATVGMLCGIKMSGPLYGLLLVAVLTLMEIRSVCLRRRSTPSVVRSPEFITLGVVGLLCFLLTGSFWYVRNWLEFGNPLGHIRVQLAGLTIFPGPVEVSAIRRTTLAHLFEPINLSHWKILGGQITEQLHFPFLGMALPALGLPLAFLSGRRHMKGEYLVGLIVLLVGTGFLYWTTPYSGDNGSHQWQITPWIGLGFRYAFPFLGLLGVAAAAGATVMRPWDKGVVAFVLLSSMLSIWGIVESKKVLCVGVLLLFGWAWLGSVKFGVRRSDFTLPIPPLRRGGVGGVTQSAVRSPQLRQLGWMVGVLLFVGMIVGATFVARERRDARRQRYVGGVLGYMSTHIGQDEVIGYLYSHCSYLFYGKELNREVVYIPSRSGDLSEWLADLRQRGIGVIAVGPLREEWMGKREISWLEAPDGPFIRVFGKNPRDEPFLYRFRGSLSAGGSG